MANFIEKKLPPKLRNNMRTLVAGALGLFLGLRYNDYIKRVIENYLPSTNGFVMEGLILVLVTIVIVYASVYLEKALDGK